METTDELQANQASVEAKRELPTSQSTEHREIVGSVDSAELAPGKIEPDRARVSVVPKQAVVAEETFSHESEVSTEFAHGKDVQKIRSTKSERVHKSVRVAEVDVTEQTVVLADEPFDTVTIASEMLSNEPLHTSEHISHETVTDIRAAARAEQETANIDYQEHSANITTETIVSQRETSFEKTRPVVELTANLTTASVEGVEITEVLTTESEQPLLEQQRSTTTAQVKHILTESKPLEVTEVVAESTSTKYYPELVVATEVASKSVVEQKPYDCLEPFVSEREEALAPKMAAVSSEANINYELQESKEVSAVITHDKEVDLVQQFDVESAVVSSDITVHRSLQVTSQETSERETPLESQAITKTREAKPAQEQPLSLATTEEVTPSLSTDDSVVQQPSTVRAQVLNDVHQSTDVSQVVAFEEISDLKAQENPAHSTATGSHTEHRSVVIESHQLPEHEEVLHDKVSTSAVAKNIQQDENKSIIVETVEALASVKDLTPDAEQTKAQATVARDQTQETIISETHIFENTTDLSPMQTQTTSAQAGFPEVQRSLDVTEIEINETEVSLAKFEPIEHRIEPKKPVQELKSLTREEVETSQTVAAITPTQYSATHGQLIEAVHELTVNVTETHLFGGTQDLVPNVPVSHVQASTAFNEQKSVSVSIQETVEHEDELVPKLESHTVSATVLSTHALQPAMVEETIPSQSTGNIDDVTPSMQAAKVNSSSLEASEVSMITPFDSLSDAPKISMTPTTTANVISDDQHSTRVHETVAYDSLTDLESTQELSGKTAVVTVDEMKSVLIQDTQTEEKTVEFVTKPTATTTGTSIMTDNVRQHVTTDEITTSQTTTDLSEKPLVSETAKLDVTHQHVSDVQDTQTFDTLEDDLPQRAPKMENVQAIVQQNYAIGVETTSEIEHEVNFEDYREVRDQHAKYNINKTLNTAQVEETVDHGITESIPDTKIDQRASSIYSEVEPVMTSQIDVINQTDDIVTKSRAQTQTASVGYDENQSVVVSIDEAALKEDVFLEQPKIPLQKAVETHDGSFNVVSVQDNEVLATAVPLETITPSYNARVKQENQEQTQISEITVFEQEKPLELPSTKPYTAQKEQNYLLKSAVTEEVMPHSSTIDLHDLVTAPVQPSMVQTTSSSTTTTTEVQVFEHADDIAENIIEHVKAMKHFTELSSLEQIETNIIDTVTSLIKQEPTTKQAITDIDTLDIPTKTIITTKETVLSLKPTSREECTASVEHITNTAIMVETAQSEVHEQDFDAEQPKSLRAQPTVNEVHAFEQADTIPCDSTVTIDNLREERQHAKPITDSRFAVNNQETLSEEKVYDLPQLSSHKATQAKPGFTNIEATVQIETIAAHSIRPLQEPTHIDQQATETTYTRTQNIAESCETSTVESTVVLESHNLTDDTPRRVSVIFDTFENSVVEEIASNETTSELNISAEASKSAIVKPSDAMHSVEVTEIHTSELNDDFITDLNLQHTAVLTATDKYETANLETITVRKGRYQHVCVCFFNIHFNIKQHKTINIHLHFSLLHTFRYTHEETRYYHHPQNNRYH